MLLRTLLAAALLAAGAAAAAAQKAPRDAEDFYNRGLIRLRQGQLALGEQDFAAAARLDPSLKPALEKYLSEVSRRRARPRQ